MHLNAINLSLVGTTGDHNGNKAIRACFVPSLPSSIFQVNYLYTNIFIYDFTKFSLHDSLQACSGIPANVEICLNTGIPLYACRAAFNFVFNQWRNTNPIIPVCEGNTKKY